MNEQSPKVINADAQLVNDAAYQTLVENISKAVELAHQKLATAVNTILIDTNWEIGRYIVEFEQHGNARAKYGDNLINRLSKDLTIRLGKGYSKSNLLYIRKFYYTFAKDERLSHLFAQKGETPSHLLSWSHYFEILKLEDPLEISFYVHQCEQEHWSVGELKRQKKSLLFQRLALCKDKEGDNPPIGIILGSEKDKLLMEYALHGISNQLFVSRYQLYLPDREQLERELQNILLEDNEQ